MYKNHVIVTSKISVYLSPDFYGYPPTDGEKGEAFGTHG
jgi:hypothetical protein